MPKPSTRYVTVQLTQREQKAAVDAVIAAAAAAPRGSRFREWTRAIALKLHDAEVRQPGFPRLVPGGGKLQ